MIERYLVVLWVTGRCNLNCKYCYAADNSAKCDMKPETAVSVLEKLKGYPLKIQFAGGEPLMNFSLVEQVCEYVHENALDAAFSLQTNGTLITAETAKKLKRLGISVGVSLDGIPEINELTRGKTAEAVNGIKLLAAEGVTVGLNCVVTEYNVNELSRLVDFAFYLGNVGGIGLDLLRNAGRGKEVSRASAEQLQASVRKMHERTEKLYGLGGRKIAIREIEQAKKRLTENKAVTDYCYASCGRSAVVLPDGRIFPCGSLIKDGFCEGNAESFSTAEMIRLKAKINDDCCECKYNRICPKGCPSRSILDGGNELDCALLKASFEIAERTFSENLD